MTLDKQSKAELRKKLKFARKTVVKKSAKDTAIFKTLINMPQFIEAKQILMYLALDDEINIDAIIDLVRVSGKSVAVPFCTDSDGNMDFYYINTLDEVKIGSFGVREPNVDICKKMTDFKDSIIIVPAISFDTNGYRLGYGKGYYDRFLQKYPFISIGLCYNSLIQTKLPINQYDQAVDYVITDTRIIDINNGGKNG